MPWIFRTLWSGLRSRFPGSRAAGSVAQASAVPDSGSPPKHFYSLIVEVRLDEAEAATLRLFSDAGVSSLAATINLPAGCELRRCLYISPEFAEALIEM
jgi:hypothetical protein